MPTRKPSGVVTSSTVTITEPFQIGCHSTSQRISTGSAMPMPKKIGVTHSTRSQPGRVNRCHPPAGGAAGACGSCACVTAVTLLALPGDGRHVLRDVGDLGGRQLALERRHAAAAVRDLLL